MAEWFPYPLPALNRRKAQFMHKRQASFGQPAGPMQPSLLKKPYKKPNGLSERTNRLLVNHRGFEPRTL